MRNGYVPHGLSGTIYLPMNKILSAGMMCRVCTVTALPQNGLLGMVKCNGSEASLSSNLGFEVAVGVTYPELSEKQTDRPIRVGSRIIALIEERRGGYRVSAWGHEDEYQLALVNVKSHQQTAPTQHVPKKCCHGGKPAMPRRYPSLGGAVSAC